MSETQFQQGIADLRRRLSTAGLSVLEQRENPDNRMVFFEIGSPEKNTDFMVSREFLSDFQRTEKYLESTNEYIHGVAARHKCGSPEHFYCSTGLAIRVSVTWPIQTGIYKGQFTSVMLVTTTDLKTGNNSKNSVHLEYSDGLTIFDSIAGVVNTIRAAIDDGNGQIKLVAPKNYREAWDRVERREVKSHSQAEVESFLRGKAFMLGFMVSPAPTSEIWAVDPWDAKYLGVPTRMLLLAMRSLIAKGLLEQGMGPEYARPSNKLLSEWSFETTESRVFQPQVAVTRTKVPLVEVLIGDIANFLPQHPLSALILMDLDHFKRLNDARGHILGDDCLDKAFEIMKNVVGRRGKIYKWGQGGDEFAAFLPDFSTEEAQLVAERIRSTITQQNLGDDLPVTASIGVCATDKTGPKSPKEFVDHADQAVFEAKRRGGNCVTVWPFTPTDNPVEERR